MNGFLLGEMKQAQKKPFNFHFTRWDKRLTAKAQDKELKQREGKNEKERKGERQECFDGLEKHTEASSVSDLTFTHFCRHSLLFHFLSHSLSLSLKWKSLQKVNDNWEIVEHWQA